MSTFALAVMLLAPLAGAIANGVNLFLGDRIFGYRQVQAITVWTAVAAFGGAAVLLVLQIAGAGASRVAAFPWFEIAGTRIDMAFLIDPLSAVMAALVTGFGAVIARFSVNYMFNETGFTRYFAAYSLFLFAMLLLVTADNLLTMFIGWEGVGICSYLLIGHYQDRPAAARAATEAFIANRVGDAGLILAVLILLTGAGTVAFADLGVAVAAAPGWVAPAAALCLLVAVMGKSAQVPLGGWLGKAMEGPTPSSALIHAATMVTAGVYLIVRAQDVFDAAPSVLTLVAIVGALSALYGALVGQVSTDIKGVLASSTTMHLGLMILLCGLGAYGVAIFYLVSHAFYKSYKFLTAPSILHHLHGKLDFAADEPRIEAPGWLVMAGILGAGLVVVPLVSAVAGGGGALGATGALLMAGGATVALATIGWLAIDGARRAFAAQAGHGHGHDGHGHHGHDQAGHHAGHCEPSLGSTGIPAGAETGGLLAPLAVTPAMRAFGAIALAAALGFALQVLPGGASGTWFGSFLGTAAEWRGPAGEAGPGVIALAVLIVALAGHAVMSVLFLTRARSERRVGAQLAGLTPLYVAAVSRFWIDALIQRGPVRWALALSAWLARLDRRIERLGLSGPARGADALGEAVRLLDDAPRRLAEGLPAAFGQHLGEAGAAVEAQLIGGGERATGWGADSIARLGLRAERSLARPAVAVMLILIGAIAVLLGA